jgi:hypothetical protein
MFFYLYQVKKIKSDYPLNLIVIEINSNQLTYYDFYEFFEPLKLVLIKITKEFERLKLYS